MDEVLALGGGDQIAQGPGLDFQAFLDRLADSFADNLEGPLRSRVVAAGLLLHVLTRDRKKHRSADGVFFEQQRTQTSGLTLSPVGESLGGV